MKLSSALGKSFSVQLFTVKSVFLVLRYSFLGTSSTVTVALFALGVVFYSVAIELLTFGFSDYRVF